LAEVVSKPSLTHGPVAEGGPSLALDGSGKCRDKQSATSKKNLHRLSGKLYPYYGHQNNPLSSYCN